MTIVSDEVTIEVAATPERVWSLVSDVTRMGEWSPLCTRCEWLGESTEPQVGNRFIGFNRQSGVRSSRECIITASDPGREFAFNTLFRGNVSNRWRYRFESILGGTRVVESYEVLVMPRWVRAIRCLPGMVGRSRRDARHGMQVTLNRLKETAERNP